MRGAALAWMAGAGLALAAAAAAGPEAAAIAPAPYDAANPKPHRIEVTLDLSAARQILDALSTKELKPGDASALLALDAVQRQVRDSGKAEPDWVRDFAGAFAEESRPGTFDLRSVRLDRDRWQAALARLELGARALAGLAARRAAALVPDDVPVALSARVEITFGIAGLADHFVQSPEVSRIVVVVDAARALSLDADAPEALSRLAAQETFRAAWEIYRRSASGWLAQSRLGPLESLARPLAVNAPAALFFFDDHFFPLSRWLKEPMVRSIDAFNNEAGILLDPETELSKRAELMASMQAAGFVRDPALAAGPFMADGIFQRTGYEALMKALAGGPGALLSAYESASGKKSGLPPLDRKIKELLAASASSH